MTKTEKFLLTASAVLSALIALAIGIFVWIYVYLCIGTFGQTMLLAFLTDVTLINQSGEKVNVTCLGVCQGGGSSGAKVLSSLPLYRRRKFINLEWAESIGSAVNIPLAPSEEKTICYDFDDINFCWILIRGESGNYKVIRTGLSDDPAHCCSPPLKKVFIIPPLSTLPDAPKELIEVAEAEIREEHK